jgi:hypothetical protein
MMTEVERQRWLRIRLAIAAYAYEHRADSIMSDAVFDSLSQEVDVTIDTGNPRLDKFFREKFDPSTGAWIWNHPELRRITELYEQHFQRSQVQKGPK